MVDTEVEAEFRGAGVYIDASSVAMDRLFNCIESFFSGFGYPTKSTSIKAPDWESEGLLELVMLPAQVSATGKWVLVLDSATADEREAWVKALAKYCFDELGQDTFWFSCWPKTKVPVAPGECGWFTTPLTKGTRPKPGRDPHGLVQSFPHPFLKYDSLASLAPSVGKGIRKSAFRIHRWKFLHFLEFGPGSGHPPRPKPLALTETKGSLKFNWSAAAKKKIRPLRGQGRQPKAPSGKKLTSLYAKVFAHRGFLRTEVPDRILQTWTEGVSVDVGERSEEFRVAWFLNTARVWQGANQTNLGAFESGVATLIDVLVAGDGLASTIGVLGRVRDVEIEDTDGSWFRRLAVSVCVWMRLRNWASTATEVDFDAAFERVLSRNDMEFRCAAALAFPGKNVLWQPYIDELLIDVGQQTWLQRIRLTSLAACPATLGEALLLFESRDDMANTYEYPTLVHTLGTASFDLVASSRPTDPKAMESRILALSVFTGTQAVDAIRRSKIPNQRVQKLVDAYLGHYC